MVSRYALVCDGQVLNVTLWDGESDWTPDDGCTLHELSDDSPVGPGWGHDGDVFTAPAPDPTQPATVQVTVDPDALEAARVAVTKATTVASLRTAVVNALALLTTEG